MGISTTVCGVCGGTGKVIEAIVAVVDGGEVESTKRCSACAGDGACVTLGALVSMFRRMQERGYDMHIGPKGMRGVRIVKTQGRRSHRIAVSA